jgi:hypothetical protein
MQFLRSFNAEVQRLAPLFAAAEKADKEFHQAWEEGCAKMGFWQYKQTERYGRTLTCFHDARQAIDKIVLTSFMQAKLGDLSQLPSLFAYIALPGRYFRSGYHRADIWRFVKKLPLDRVQTDILRGIILRQIVTAGPEFREMSCAASKIDSAELREKVSILALQSEKDYVRRRANRIISRLEG